MHSHAFSPFPFSPNINDASHRPYTPQQQSVSIPYLPHSSLHFLLIDTTLHLLCTKSPSHLLSSTFLQPQPSQAQSRPGYTHSVREPKKKKISSAKPSACLHSGTRIKQPNTIAMADQGTPRRAEPVFIRYVHEAVNVNANVNQWWLDFIPRKCFLTLLAQPNQTKRNET